jgi:hypothetical protein
MTLGGRGHWLVQGLTPPVIGSHTEVNTPRPCNLPEASRLKTSGARHAWHPGC